MSMSFLGPMDPGKLFGDITGSNQAAKGAENAANAQIQAAQDSNALMKYMYDTNRTDLTPYRQVGGGALNMLAAMSGLNPDGTQRTGGADFSAFTNSPGYQFALDQGQQSLQRQLAASGMSGSGAAMKEAQRYGQGVAGQQFGGYMNRLANLAGVGQSATNQTGAYGQQYATQAGNNLVDMGNARGSAYIARGNVPATNFRNLSQLGMAAGGMMMGGGGMGGGMTGMNRLAGMGGMGGYGF